MFWKILAYIMLAFAFFYATANDYAHATFNLLLGALLLGRVEIEKLRAK